MLWTVIEGFATVFLITGIIVLTAAILDTWRLNRRELKKRGEKGSNTES